jgi:hypothetical protein
MGTSKNGLKEGALRLYGIALRAIGSIVSVEWIDRRAFPSDSRFRLAEMNPRPGGLELAKMCCHVEVTSHLFIGEGIR